MKRFTLFCLFLAIIMMPKTMSAQSLLYSENFDASTSLPSGWTHPSSGSLTMESGHARAGNCLKFSGANPNVAVMPNLGVEISSVELTFWERPEGSSSGDFDLGYVTDPNDANSFVQVMTWNNSKGLTYEEHANISFASAPAGARIAFRQRPSSTAWYWFVDDIEVYQTLPCNGPTGLYISDLTTTSATLNWGMTTGGSDNPTYMQVEVKDENGVTVYSNNQVSGTAYQLPLTGLSANTTYSVRMRGDCDVTYSGYSAWTSFSFTTACELTELPYVQNFDGLNGVPDCTTSLNASINSSTKYGSTGKSLQLSTTAGASAYMVFPLVNGVANNLQFTAMLKSSLSSGSLTYMIGIVADAADIEGTFEPLLVDSLTDADWHDIGMNTALASVATTGTSICVFVGSGISASLYIDDVDIRPIPTCTRPEQFRGYDVTSSTYTLSWSTTNATTCRVEIVNLDNSTTTYQTATTNPYTVTGLTPQTNYKFRIWGVCSATDSSQMTSYIQTKTLCSVLSNPVFFEGAEGTTGSDLPDCWTYGFWTRTGTTTYDQPFNTQTGTKHNGSRAFSLRDMSSGNISYLASPGMTITTPNEYEVSIWMYRPSGTSNVGEGLHFWLSNSADNVDAGSNAVDLGFYNRYAGNAPVESGSGWFNYVFPISLTGDVYFIIEGDSKYGASTYFDDIEVRLAPSCFKPGDADMAFTDSTATVFWQPSVSAPASYAIAYTVKRGTTTVATDSLEVTGTTYTIPGLTANTSYTLTARIYAVCSATDISEAKVFSRSFKTPCVTQAIPYTEDFEGMGSNTVPGCWDNSGSTTSDLSANPHYVWGVYAYGGNNMLRMYNYLVHAGLAMITSPVINLPAGSAYELSFDYSHTATCGDFTVSVTTDGGLTYTDLGTYSKGTGSSYTDPGTFTNQIISLNQFAGNDIIIKFSANANYGSGAIFIDNVSVNMASACPRLTGAIGNVTDTTAAIIIPEDCAWQISYGPEGTAADDGTIIDVASGTTATITGLVGMTSYVAYVRTVCDTNYGVWSRAISFRTACASNVFPYSTSFEGMTEGAVPECWDLAGTTATSSTASYLWGVYNNSNNNSVRLYNAYVQSGLACLVSPSVRLAAGGNYLFSFSHSHMANCSAMDVQISTDGGANYTTIFTVPASGQTSSTAPGTFNDEEIDISAYAGNDINIRFAVTTNYSSGAIFIDNVSIDIMSGCMKLNGAAQNVQDITADIVITDSCAWEISYGTAGTAAGAGTVVAVPAGTTTYTLTGLNGQTNYVAYVRRVCDTTYSVWSKAIAFKTLCAALPLPYNEGFETVSANSLPDCWTFGASTGDIYYYVTSNDAQYIYAGSKAFYIDAYDANSSDWIVAAFPNISNWRNAELKFMWRTYDSSYDDLYFGYLTNAGDVNSFVQTDFLGSTNDWTLFEKSMADLPANAAVPAIKYIGYWYAAFDNITMVQGAACPKLGATVNNITDVSADITAAADTCAWQYIYGVAGTVDTTATPVSVPAGTTTVNLTGLTESTIYNLYVRRQCGPTEFGVWSNVITFKTTVTPTYAPFATGFEDAADNMKWEFVNSTGGNDWVIGTDADAVSTGSKALYVSVDGSTYSYSTGNASKSFAYRTISFDAANYTLSFRWKCTGGESTWDFGNVLIIPAAEPITGGSGTSYSSTVYPNYLYSITPSEDKNFFNLTQGEDADGWNTFTGVLDMTAHPGVYNFAFMWNNDGSSGSDYPFAIDNLRISQITCNAPAVVASGTSADTTTIQCGSSDATQWEVVVSTTPIDVFGEVTGDIYQGVTSGPVGIGGLTPNTAYYYTARAICQPGDTSDWATAQTVRTACMAYSAPYTETFEDMGALNCWTSFGNVEPVRTTSYHYAGMASMKVTDGAAISPEFNIPSMETYMVNGFAYATADSTMFSIGVMVDPEDGGTFEVLGQEMIATRGQWQEFTAYFTLLGDEDYEDFADAKHFALVVGGDATVYFDNVIFGETPECPKPTEVAISNVLSHSFDLSWTDNAGATTWIVKAVPAMGSTVTQTVTTNPATITGLNAQTQYSVTIAAICSASDTSYEASCGTIKTACDVVNLPYQETFETMATDATPDCWDISASTSSSATANPHYVWGVYSFGGTNMLRMYNYYCQSGSAVINSPLIALPTGLGSEMTFEYAHNASCGAFDLQISTDAGATFTTLQSFTKGSGTSNTDPGTWTPVNVNLGAYTGQTVMFRFNSTANYGSGAIFVDNILIKQLKACSDLTSASAINITDNSADVVFTDTCTTHTQWQYAYGPAGFDLESAALTTVTTDTISLTGLTASTMYTLYVRAYCDATEQSNWYSVSFKTLSEPAPLPYVCGFDDPAELAAWDLQSSGGSNAFVFGNASSALSAGSTNALYVSNNGSSHTYGTSSASAATASRLFYFPAGRYVVMFDWLCSGGESAYDYARFYFVPAATGVQLPTTGSYQSSYYPSNMIPLDGGTYHNLTNGWQHVDQTVDFTSNPGGYYLVFTWANDGSAGTPSYPLAINNVVVADEATFCRPIEGGVTVLGSSATTMTVSAQMQPAHTAIVFAYGPSATTNSVADTVGSVTSATGSAVLTGLTPGTQYNVYAMGICNSGDSTVWTSAATGTTKTDDCFEPENVRIVGAPTDVAATITWVGAPDVTSYEWTLISGGATVMTDVTSSDTVALTGLTPATNYTFQVRGFCGTTDTTNWVTLTFATTKSLAVLPYMCDFETASENNQWDIYNGSQTNKFVIGSSTGNTGSSLYITTSLTSKNYTYNTGSTSNVCATRMFQLPAGQYSYSYDWQCEGESTYDYGRVFLVPDGAVAPVAGTQVASHQTDVTSAGGYNLDKENGSSYYKLNLGTGWTNVSGTFTVPTTGNYLLIVQWHNDATSGTPPPFAIDNIQLAALTCPQPTVTVSAGETTATANIVFNTASDSIVYAVSNGSYATAFFADTVSGQNTINLTGLAGSTSYNLYLKVICGANDESMLVTVPFRTTCGVTALPYTEGFEELPSSYTQHMINALCWDDLGASASSGTYPYYYGNTNTSYVSEGSKSLFMVSSATQNMYFIMPDFGTVANAHIAYDSRVENVNSSGTVQVGYMTNVAQASTFVSLYSTPKTTSMASYSVDVANMPAGARIAFAYVNASSDYYYASVDNIRVSQLVSGDTYYDTICHNTPFVNFGFNIPANQMTDGNNTFTRTKSGVTGAPDTVITANVFMLPEMNTITYDTACAGVPYVNGLFNIPAPQTRSYFRTFTSALGCDSTVTLYLTVEDTYEDRFDTICQGDVYTFEGQQLTAAGDYTAYTTTSHGCTDTVVLHLSVVATRDTVVETICQGTSYVWHGMTYSTSGTYMWTGPGQHGCTQVSTLILTVLDGSSSRNVTICNGGSYQFRDTLITTPGTYSRTYYDVTIGCTVTETIVVTMDDLISADVYDVACQDHPYYGYGVNGVTITKDTVISIASKTAALCDSVTNVHLTFIATKYGDAYAHIAEGETYEWYDNTYSVAGEYHETLQSAEGCDSIVALHLAVGGAVDNVNGVHVDVVPNPVRPGMTAYVYGEFGEVETVEILNNFGQVVDRFAPSSYPIEVQGLEVEGLYYVRVITRKGEIYTEKLLVK